jgi:drug/metabolite transporter (DMT)-like permease
MDVLALSERGDLFSSSQVGLLAALGAASIWSVASILFSAANRHMQPSTINLLRLLVALVLMFGLHLSQTGFLLPEASETQWLYLGLSGVIGLGLGDLALFYAFDAVGPRLAMLIAASAPVMAAILGFIFLREQLSLLAIFGILLALFGIVWVVSEKGDSTNKKKNIQNGVIFGLLAAAGQAIGVLLTKQGMTHGAPLSAPDAALIRMLTASSVMLPLQSIWFFQRKSNAEQNFKKGLPLIVIGSIMGTLIGMSLSMVAARNAELGKAQTILSLPPVLILPLSYYVQKEKITARAVVGALIAVAGTALLFIDY